MRRAEERKVLVGSSFVLFLLLYATFGASQDLSRPIRLSVDLSEAPRRIFHARLVIPAAPGPLTLLYPKWIPGEHGPTGPITNLAGIKFAAGGKPLAWRRDDVEMYAFHCQVPPGADSVEVELDYLSPTEGGYFTASPVATTQLAVLNWNLILVYPQGRRADELTYAASLRLPPGWKFGTALPVAHQGGQSGDTVEFAPVSLTTLVDSPVITGAHFRAVPLVVEGAPPHEIDLAGESEAAIGMSPQLARNYTQLVAEALALFGAHHYRGYHFLFALSDYVEPFGLEHHESSDNRLPERTLIEDALRKLGAELLPHEFVHSWNAKYRRPAGLTTSDFHQPMQGELLWVYEGLTQYLGELLTARSGLRTPEEFRENLAQVAAYLDHRPGRTWRPLADTAVAAQTLYGAPQEWASWRRGVDFYDESALIWLEADVIIRRQNQDRRSLDDFCRLFLGGPSGPPEVKPYTYEDILTALNEVAPYDWRAFFNARLNSTGPRAPLGGLEASGWRVVYTDVPNDLLQAAEREQDFMDLSYSIGLVLKHKKENRDDGRILDVIHGMPAAQAGIGPGMRLVAVNGRAWSPEVLREAVAPATGAQTAKQPLELLVENAGFYRTHSLNYHGGERYPHLERDPGRPDLLSEITRRHAAQPPAAGTQ
jgi:predicted metalloprotease with PDZ domain